jgi:hypothetical protein
MHIIWSTQILYCKSNGNAKYAFIDKNLRKKTSFYFVKMLLNSKKLVFLHTR